MDNYLYIPFLNPVKFYKTDRAITTKFQTKHFDEFPFGERFYDWDIPESYRKPWQTTDIINIQFESSFDPLIVTVHRYDGVQLDVFPALVGIPNRQYTNIRSYTVNISLAGYPKGCFYLKLTAGASGPTQQVFETPMMYLSDTALKNSILIEYWSSKDFHDDVMFVNNFKFNTRMFGYIGRLKPGRTVEKTKDERYNPAILSSRAFRQFPVHFGDRWGLPEDEIDLLNCIMGCDNVIIDQKFFCAADDEFELFEIENKPKIGCKLMMEEGLNRRSYIFVKNVDTNKRLFYAISAEPKFFGDTSNQGSANTIPIVNVIE